MELTSFCMAYLLGVEESVLERDYQIEFAHTDELKDFQQFQTVEILRALSRIRLSAIRYYYLYRRDATIKEITKEYLREEFDIIKGIGINAEVIFKEYGFVKYLNYLTLAIEEMKVETLKELKLPMPNLLKRYFYFPMLDYEEIEKISKDSENLDRPHGIILYGAKKISSSLLNTLSDKQTLFKNVYKLLGKNFNENSLYKITFSLEIQSNEEKEYYKNIKSNFREKLRIIHSEIANDTKVVNLDNMASETRLEMPKLDSKNLNFISQPNTQVFVDCDNTDFFKVLNFFRLLKEHKTIDKITLVIDDKTNFLWKKLPEILNFSNKMFNNVEAKRIKDNKSVADVVLTKEFSKSVFLEGMKNAIIISSDSDFYGLLQSFSEINFLIGYTNNKINKEYLNFLKENNYISYNLSHLDTKALIAEYKDQTLTYILSYVLGRTPIKKWNNKIVFDMVEFHFTKETNVAIPKHIIKEFISEKLPMANVEILNNTTLIKIGDISIDSSEF